MSDSNEIERVIPAAPITNSLAPRQIAEALWRSGYFPDVRSQMQAYVKIMIGEEFGLSAHAAMTGITIIEGRLGFMSNLLATFVQESSRFKYKVREASADVCKIEFFELEGDEWESLGVSEWSSADTQRAELSSKANHKRYPKAMNFNRALSQGIRLYCPSVTNGTPAYTPDEIGADVDATGQAQNVAAPAVTGDADADVTDASVVVLDEDQVDHLIKGIDVAGMSLDDVNMMLGAHDAGSIDPVDGDQRDHLSRLSLEQFEAISTELAEKADLAADASEAADGGDELDEAVAADPEPDPLPLDDEPPMPEDPNAPVPA